MDIKAEIMDKINEIVEKIKSNPNLAQDFQQDPSRAIKDISGVDVPEDQLKSVIDAIMAKLGGSELGEKLGGLLNKFKKE